MDNQTPPTANPIENPTAAQTPPSSPKSFLSKKTIFITLFILIILAIIFAIPFPRYIGKTLCAPCQDINNCPPCPSRQWIFEKSIFWSIILPLLKGTTVNSTVQVNTSRSVLKPTPETNQENVLKIPEYGVQIALSDEIKDAYYINTTASKGYVYLKVHSLNTEPQCKKDDSSTASLSRVGKDEINPMTDGKYSDSFKGKIIGNYFYYIDLAQYSCADTTEGKAKLEKVRSAFTTAEIIQ